MENEFAKQWCEIAKTDLCNEAIATDCSDEDKFNESGVVSVGVLNEILEKYDLKKDLRFLEIGCGSGRETQYIKDMFPRMVGIDCSEEMIRKAKERTKNEVSLLVCDGESIPSGDKTFDIVYSNIVLQHCPQDIVKKYFKEVERVLDDNGYFIFQLHTGKEHKEPESFRSYSYWTCDEIRENLNLKEIHLEETGELCKFFIFKK